MTDSISHPVLASPHYSQYLTNPTMAGITIRPEFIELATTENGMRIDYQGNNPNIDSILQVHRRKMLRRAANRRSAQLSRARKKAHLEDLKIENSRLQRLVDVLDSQPEIVFCMNSTGRLTYLSERTLNFIRNFFTDDSDDEPTHLNQILTQDSADKVINCIAQLIKHSTVSNNNEFDSNMIFASKQVYFNDAFGPPLLLGHLRCSRIYPRTALQEIQTNNDAIVDGSLNGGENSNSSFTINSAAINQPAKKSKKTAAQSNAGSNSSQSTSLCSKQELETRNNIGNIESTFISHSTNAIHTNAQQIIKPSDLKLNFEEKDCNSWNLSKFKFLTDCVTSLAAEEENLLQNDDVESSNKVVKPTTESRKNANSKRPLSVDSKKKSHPHGFNEVITKDSTAGKSNKTDSSPRTVDSNCQRNNMKYELNGDYAYNSNVLGDMEEEFVCVVRTADACFVPYHVADTKSDLLMFSSLLSTASMVAHDLEPRVNASTSTEHHHRGSSPNGSHNSSGSNNSSGAQPNSDGSKEIKIAGSSTGSSNSNRSNSNANSTSSETCSDDRSEEDNNAEIDST